MIKRILNNKILNGRPSHSVVSAAFLITIAGLASRVLGLFRDRFLASAYGAGDTLDVYYAAFRVPDLIYNLLILGALSAAFIPVFTGLVSNDKKDDAWEMASGIMNIAIILLVLFSGIFCVFSPWIMKAITPGFSPDKMAQVVFFTRVMFLSPIFLGISGIFGGILTSFKRFMIYSLAPIFYNIGIIIGIVVFTRFLGPAGLAWGVVFGAFLHMMVQYPTAKHLGFRHSWSLATHIKSREVRKVVRLMIPRTLGIAVSQVNLLIITIFASTLAAGSLAVFNFAQNLQSVPLGVIGVSFAIAVFPTLSAYAAKKDDASFIQAFSETFRQVMFFIIPASVFMLLLRAQLVRVILGAGKFDWNDTTLTFQVLGIFAMSLFAQSVIPLLARSFYALHDTKTPFYIAVVSEIVNILSVVLLIRRYEILSLAMAFSFANLVQMLLLLFFLRTKFESLDDKKIISSILKVALASVGAGLSIQLVKQLSVAFVNMDTFLGVFSQMAASSAAGVLVFILACHALKIEEYLLFKASLTKKIFKAKKEIVEDTGEVSGI
jgi:putative peptidoglycan lipid II flippase